MANYTTNAINLKSYNLSEADRIILMYSRDHGIIRCVAKGIRKPASKLGGRMEALVANKLLVAKGKSLDIVCQAESIEIFKEIRKDITKLTYAIYCAELVSTFGLENDPNSQQIYDIFFENLKDIALSKNTDEILWAVIRFQLRLMKQLGYAVELDTCVKCNNSIQNNLFSFCSESGGIICERCGTYTTNDINDDIRKIFKDAINFDFSENSVYYRSNQLTLSYCFKLLKDYIAFRSHKKLKSPELIECLC